MPVGETGEPVPIPSGEVVPMVGVGLAIPVTCATAMLLKKSTGMTAAISKNLIGALGLPDASPRRAPMSTSFATIPLDGGLLDIAQSLSIGPCGFGRICGDRYSIFCSLTCPLAGSWLARAICSIKYEFMFSWRRSIAAETSECLT
jgi:hypothetical protein